MSSNAYHDYHEVRFFGENIFNCYCFYRIYSMQTISNKSEAYFFSGVSIPESEKEEEERQGNDRKLELGKADILQSFSSLKKAML